MNDLNTKLQQKAQYANEMYGYNKCFMNKLRFWKAHIQNANLSLFSTFEKTRMHPKKTEFANQVEKLLNKFLACFKTLNQ